MMTEAARKAFLERDQWARDVEPRSVRCAGCEQTLSLDKRKGAFYASLWLKHRASCREIKRLKAKNMPSLKEEEEEVSISLPFDMVYSQASLHSLRESARPQSSSTTWTWKSCRTQRNRR
jgi:hypothetical protein